MVLGVLGSVGRVLFFLDYFLRLFGFLEFREFFGGYCIYVFVFGWVSLVFRVFGFCLVLVYVSIFGFSGFGRVFYLSFYI